MYLCNAYIMVEMIPSDEQNYIYSVNMQVYLVSIIFFYFMSRSRKHFLSSLKTENPYANNRKSNSRKIEQRSKILSRRGLKVSLIPLLLHKAW